MATDLDNLPEDVEALRAALRLVHSQNIELAARNAELETINQRLAELLGYYKRLKFGRTSEKRERCLRTLALTG